MYSQVLEIKPGKLKIIFTFFFPNSHHYDFKYYFTLSSIWLNGYKSHGFWTFRIRRIELGRKVAWFALVFRLRDTVCFLFKNVVNFGFRLKQNSHHINYWVYISDFYRTVPARCNRKIKIIIVCILYIYRL